ncbi:type II toxin-antitoxin system Phd/YefM family antitoxin [Stutzerimonas nitrititolerans]|uniref:type II toxin-antitoxin system Phd/YefM family antitoxin n=1 Tax=Stutzerimonas nitrititolerans TaxID=2482751 RepID=UPI001BDCE9D3|nr:type II toxin-antitoxin system prevent-host-death family antitoxin [Stutzerimonas nitrititolerans]MBT1119014.1 type II toxin-antitoxin system prevent-host-death family antitoxin [Stutzerimonas nitrititolerans]
MENIPARSPKTVNIHDAKTNLSRLILEATQGRPFVITKAGKPMVKVVAIDQENRPRLGMLAGVFEVPDDIDTPFKDEIKTMFGA